MEFIKRFFFLPKRSRSIASHGAPKIDTATTRDIPAGTAEMYSRIRRLTKAKVYWHRERRMFLGRRFYICLSLFFYINIYAFQRI